MKRQAGIKRQLRCNWYNILLFDVVGAEAQPVVIAETEMCIGVSPDGGIHDHAAIFVTIGRQVGAATGEAEAQRRPGSYTDACVPDIRRIALSRADGDCCTAPKSLDRQKHRVVHEPLKVIGNSIKIIVS